MKRQLTFRIDWLLVFLLLLPTFYVAGKDLRHVQMNCFQLSIIAMLALVHVNCWIGAFLGWSLFQMIFFPNIPGTSIVIQNIFFGALLYHFIIKYCSGLKRYYWALIGLLGFNVFWAILQMYHVDPLFMMVDYKNQSVITEWAAFFSLPAFFGNFAAVLAPLCLYVFPPTALLVIPVIIWSKSSFSILALFVGVLFFLWFRKRILFWITLIILGTLSTVYVIKYDAPSGQFGKRLVVWNLIIRESLRTQFFGHGVGSYNNSYVFIEAEPSGNTAMVQTNMDYLAFISSEAARTANVPVLEYMNGIKNTFNRAELIEVCKKNGISIHAWGDPHNEFLRVFFEQGLLGLFIVFGYISMLFKRFFSIKKPTRELVALMACFLSILVVSFAHFPFYVARLGGIFIVLMAFLELKLIEENNA